MKVINLSGIVGYNLTAKSVKDELDKMSGEAVRFDINSPGGSVFDGLEIYNLIKNYEGETETRLVSIGASMGSIISLAGDKKTAEDTAVYMIHNASGIAKGDYRDMEKSAELLKNISNHVANIYVKNTDLEKSEILDMMDNETWFYGSELEKMGFEMIKTEKEKDKETAQAVAKLDFQNCLEKMKDFENENEKISAIFKPVNNTPQKSAEIENNTQEAEKVDKKTLKAEHPDLYADIKAEGVQEEQKRIAELDAYADINAEVSSVIAKAKAEGKTVDAVLPEIMKASATSKPAIEAQADNAPEINAADSGDIVDSESAVNALLAMSEEV